MGVDRAIDITVKQRKIVTDLLERHLPDTAAWIYGSRVKWTARPQSDLDMVVFATPEQNGRVSDLREAFEESNLPFRVDLFVWDAVPEQFRKQIKSEHVVLVESGARDLVGEWPTDRFGRLLTEPVRNGIYKRKEFHGRGAKIVNMGELFAHPRLRAVPMKRLELSESENDRFLITAGDLLFARRSLVAEGAGKCCAVLNVDEPTTFESSIIRARPDPTRADYLYLYYFFNSALGLYHLDTIRRQVAVAGITGSDLTNLDIPVPPLPEQRAIAHILGALDDKIELNRRMNETLEAMARALFKSWFVDFDPVRAKIAARDTGLPSHLADLFPDRLVDSELGEIPEGWRIRQLGEMAIVVDCLHSRKPERQKDGPVLIQVFNIGPTGRLDFSNPYNVTEDDYAEWTRRMEVLPGDLVVTKTGRVGAVGQMPKGYKAAMGRNMVGVRAILGRSLPGFLKDSLLSDRMCREMMRNTNDGTILRSLHVKAISQLQEVLPPYDLVSSYEALIAPVHAKLEQNDVESKTLATMRDVLLPKLVSGEIHLHAAERAVENIQ